MLGLVRKASIWYRNIDLVVNSVRYIKTVPSPESIDKQTLTLSYLISSGGLSTEKAISVSRKVTIKNTETPNLVLKLLENHGFTEYDISTLISTFPLYLTACSEKTIRPKIEFLESLGIVGENLRQILCRNSLILHRILEKHIMPLISFLREHVVSTDNIVYALRNARWKPYLQSINKAVVPNLATLREQGVPGDLIRRLLVWYPWSLESPVGLFEEIVEDVKAVGFSPTNMNFILAINVKTIVDKTTWGRKKELTMSYGLSEEEFLSAFAVQPNFMTDSEKKLVSVMDFLMNNVGLKPSDIARCPKLFNCSLKRRLTPRWSFLKALMSKGLIKNFYIAGALVTNSDDFEITLRKYEKQSPEIVKAFRDGSILKDT